VVRQLQGDVQEVEDVAIPGLQRFMAEVKRRRVGKVAIAYAGFMLIAGAFASDVFGELLPEFLKKLLAGSLIALFPVVLVLSWMYDWTAEGIRRTEGTGVGGESAVVRWLQVGALALSLAFAGLVLWWAL
jgi:hypothetical protein